MNAYSPMRKMRRFGGNPPQVLSRRERATIMTRLRADGTRLAERFGLTYTVLEAENSRVKRRYGSCRSDGRIRIRLTHVRTGRALKYSSMIDTLCHELAHLKHFDHGPRFRTLYENILAWARAEGIYRPGRVRTQLITPRPVQLGLFS